MVSAITQDIRVRVKTGYQPDFSEPEASIFFFAYHISISNLGSEKVKLLKRHWNIQDSLGFERIIEGPGVVGEQPELDPGMTHNYQSGCQFTTEIGRMWGYYIFERLADGEQFKVEIPCFTMAVPYVMS